MPPNPPRSVHGIPSPAGPEAVAAAGPRPSRDRRVLGDPHLPTYAVRLKRAQSGRAQEMALAAFESFCGSAGSANRSNVAVVPQRRTRAGAPRAAGSTSPAFGASAYSMRIVGSPSAVVTICPTGSLGTSPRSPSSLTSRATSGSTSSAGAGASGASPTRATSNAASGPRSRSPSNFHPLGRCHWHSGHAGRALAAAPAPWPSDPRIASNASPNAQRRTCPRTSRARARESGVRSRPRTGASPRGYHAVRRRIRAVHDTSARSFPSANRWSASQARTASTPIGAPASWGAD